MISGEPIGCLLLTWVEAIFPSFKYERKAEIQDDNMTVSLSLSLSHIFLAYAVSVQPNRQRKTVKEWDRSNLMTCVNFAVSNWEYWFYGGGSDWSDWGGQVGDYEWALWIWCKLSWWVMIVQFLLFIVF